MWLSHEMTACDSKPASCSIWIDDSLAERVGSLFWLTRFLRNLNRITGHNYRHYKFSRTGKTAHVRQHGRHCLCGGLLSSQEKPWDVHAGDPSHALKSGPHALQRTTGGLQLLMVLGPTASPNETSTYATAPTAARSRRLIVAAMNDLLEHLSR